MNKLIKIFVSILLVVGNLPAMARADDVTDWNQIMLEALITGNVGGIVATRHAAIVQSAVYDAVNGIEPQYTPLHVQPAAAPGASRRAAAVQAAYASLLKLFPAQQNALDAKRNASLSAISSDEAVGNSQSIADGLDWGQKVADEIWEWRSRDGFAEIPSPNVGGNGVGQWRPTPAGFAAFATVQMGNVTPWVIGHPSQFWLPGPPAVDSPRYVTDFNEVKQVGGVNGSRTADQTLLARFWASANSPNYLWNRVAVAAAAQNRATLSENALILAMMNTAIADAGITIWNKKLFYGFWRPVTAIQLAETDGNVGTTSDPSWAPLIATPPYPDYPSGLAGVSAAAGTILSNFYGENLSFTMDSNAMPGVTRFFPNFSAALDEVVEARILSGIHFRFADVDARNLGTAVARYVIAYGFQPYPAESEVAEFVDEEVAEFVDEDENP